MKDGYMEPTDEGAFTDIALMPPVDGRVLCSQCKGHGGWNLKLNAYGSKNHFRAFCTNCWGWGYVEPKDANHVHDWNTSYKNVGNCLNIWKCVTCGLEREVDSSD